MIETKGDQLAGNHDTEYKRVLLDRLSEAYRERGTRTGDLGLEHDGFAFGAAVVLFSQIDARLPALIRGESTASTS